MTVHFIFGCPWADGEKYASDTDQRRTWVNVNCKHCLKLKGMGYGRSRRAMLYGHDFDASLDIASKLFLNFVLKDSKNVKEFLERL